MQAVTHTGARGADLAADVCKLARRAVGDLVLPYYRAGYFLLKESVRVQRGKQMVDTAFAELIIGCVALNKARALQNSGNVKKLYRIEASAEVGTTQRRADILDARKRRTAAHDHHFLGRARFGQTIFYLKPVRAWSEAAARFLSAVGNGLGGQHIQHDRQLKYVK